MEFSASIEAIGDMKSLVVTIGFKLHLRAHSEKVEFFEVISGQTPMDLSVRKERMQ
jgi:hypothetical protein